MPDAPGAIGKARITEQLGVSDGPGEASPEFLRRGHVQRDPFRVGAFKHIGLRNARPTVGPHNLALREIVGEVVEIEVAHCFQHRDVDAAAPAGPVAFVQRAENPERGIEARHRIGLLVLAFLVLLAGLLFLSTRKVWHGRAEK